MEQSAIEARVVLFEDDPEIRRMVHEAFAESPHSIVEEAPDRERAHLLVSLILAELLEVDVAIIGGRLGTHDMAEEIVQLLRGTSVRTVGFSGVSLDDIVNIDHTKSRSVWDLPGAVTRAMAS